MTIARCVLGAIALETLVVTAPLAQAPAPSGFEIASVRPAGQGGGRGAQSIRIGPGDRVSIVNVALETIIRAAYRIDSDQLVSRASWINNERFNINAKASMPSSGDELRMMLRTLLHERFKLAAHMETRDGTVYALVLTKRNGELGDNLRRTTVDCKALPSPINPTRVEDTPCRILAGVGEIGGRGLPIGQLALALSRHVGGDVVDRTGLTGFFEWKVTFTPLSFLNRPINRELFPSIDPDGPSIFAAVQDQLGLKLERETGSRSFLIVDSVERPDPD